MSRLEQLIAELCPDGVEYKTLGEVCDFKNGFAFKSNKFKTNGQPILRITNIQDRKINTDNIVYFDVNDYSEDLSSYIVSKADIVVAMSGATTGKIGINNTDNTYYLNQRVGKFIPNEKIISNRFLYHFLSSKQQLLLQISGGGAQPNLSSEKLKQMRIPISPSQVQYEIVCILDNLTDLSEKLTEKLTEEFTARKKQYEYYRDFLLTFGDDVPMVKLSELATDMYRGSGIKRDEITDDGTPCVRYGEIYTTYNIWFDNCVSHTHKGTKTFEYGDILFAITGETVEEIAKSCAYMGREKCFAGGDVVVMKHKQNPKYIAYALSTSDAQAQKSKGKVKSKVVHSSIPALKEIKIPLPTLDEQARIVSILDRFDELTTNITSSLPAEIEARQKQYEYYRDKLLTFKEVTA